MRVWHSAWSWLKPIVAAASVAGNTRTGMLTRLILRKPFQVGRAAMHSPPQGNYRPDRCKSGNLRAIAWFVTGELPRQIPTPKSQIPNRIGRDNWVKVAADGDAGPTF